MKDLPDLSEFDFESAVQSLISFLLEGAPRIPDEAYVALDVALTTIIAGFRNETGNLEIEEDEKEYFNFYANVMQEALIRLHPSNYLN